MKDQISVPDIREVLKITKKVAPIMNNTELVQLMSFYGNVLNRYAKEEYSNEVDGKL